MKVRDLAGRIGGEVSGDPDMEILGAATLDRATGTDVSFLGNPKYREQARLSGAGAILVPKGEHMPGRTVVLCANPYAAFARTLALFHPAPAAVPGVHPTVVMGEGCEVHESATLEAYVVLGDRVIIGSGSVIEAGGRLGDGARIGTDCRLHPNVVLYPQTVLGDRVILHAGCVLGSDGFGYAQDKDTHVKVPQIGRVVVESDVEIGANTAVDRGTLDETRIGRGSKVDNLVQIAHNVTTGPSCLLVAQSGISGSTRLGAGVIFAGQSGAVGHIELGDGVRVGAKSAVTKGFPSGSFVTGHPAKEHKLWLRERALAGRLEEILKRLADLECRLGPEHARGDARDRGKGAEDDGC